MIMKFFFTVKALDMIELIKLIFNCTIDRQWSVENLGFWYYDSLILMSWCDTLIILLKLTQSLFFYQFVIAQP